MVTVPYMPETTVSSLTTIVIVRKKYLGITSYYVFQNFNSKPLVYKYLLLQSTAFRAEITPSFVMFHLLSGYAMPRFSATAALCIWSPNNGTVIIGTPA